MWMGTKKYAAIQSELATLRERVTNLQETVAHYKAMLDDMEAAFERETARANLAVDWMLNAEGHFGITPPKPVAERLADISSMFEEDDAAVADVKARIERDGVEAILAAEVR